MPTTRKKTRPPRRPAAKARRRRRTSSYRSQFERDIAASLGERGVAFSFEAWELPYTLTYIPDFQLHGNNVLLEVKGVLDKDTIRKLRAVKAAHPKLDLRLVFMRPTNRLNPTSKTTYAQWAQRNGFPWCGPKIPDDWLT